MCTKKDKNGRGNFSELNFEAESESWFEKLEKLHQFEIWFL